MNGGLSRTPQYLQLPFSSRPLFGLTASWGSVTRQSNTFNCTNHETILACKKSPPFQASDFVTRS